jgi:tetratricopeptide (TPR) repeat protein
MNQEKIKRDPNAALRVANEFYKSGNLNDAFDLFRHILSLYSTNISILNILGEIELRRGNLHESVKFFSASINIEPKQPSAYSNRGIALNKLKRFNEALFSYDQAIALKPDYADAYSNRGGVLKELKRFDEALSSYDQALALKPDYAEAYSNRGIVLKKLKRLDEALSNYEQAIALKPDYAEAYYNRGIALKELKRFDEALVSYRQATALKPSYVAAYSNLGNLLNELKRFDEALANYDQAIVLKPDFAEAHYNRGAVLQELERFDEALAGYQQAIALKPDYAAAYWNKSLLKLLLGDYDEGWRLYEWRWRLESFTSPTRNFHQPLWLGEQSIDGKMILLHSEQGLGDTIQFCRYAFKVEALGANVIIEAPKPLISLLSTLKGRFTVVEKGSSLPDFDAHCPLMSLPLAFKTTSATIPATLPYLYAKDELLASVAAYLKNLPGYKVGLCWQGSKTHKADADRSPGLEPFKILFQVPGAHFFTLQTGSRAEFIGAAGASAVDLGHEIDELTLPFEETAALIMHLDLVITSDTSIAHLAGALGKAAWLVLPYMAEWRWLAIREDSPWYPNARLFRQSQRGDWTELFDRVTARLNSVISGESLALWPLSQAAQHISGISSNIQVPVSIGELFDKMTILEIKALRITDRRKLANVEKELAVIGALADASVKLGDDGLKCLDELREVNSRLWDIEDAIREHESRQDFGERFIELARSVYKNNDRRALLKRKLNELTGSELIEEKSYADYQGMDAI